MNRRLPTVLGVILFGCISLLGVAAQSDGAGVRRFGLYIGANDGGRERVRLRYAVSDAARLSEVMTRVGGVARHDAILLEDPSSAEITRAIAGFRAQVEREGAGARRTEFFLYYSGHSDERGLLVGEELLSYRELRQAIETVDADVAIAVLDSCSSGSFTRLKGGRRVAPFLLDDSAQMSGYAFLTSSSDDEASQESDEIGASFFTHYMVSGLLGAADSTRDGRVTLNEVYQYAFAETLSRTSATFAGPQHPSYDIQLTGAGDLILTDLTAHRSRLELDGDVAGRVFVRDEATGRLVAEFEKYPDAPLSVALAAGRYRVEVRSGSELLVASATLGEASVAVVGSRDLADAELERNRVRGDETGASTFDEIRRRAQDAVARIGAAVEQHQEPDSLRSEIPSLAARQERHPAAPVVVDVIPGIRVFPREPAQPGDVHNVVLGVPIAEVNHTDGIAASLGIIFGEGDTNGVETSYVGSIRRGRVRGVQSGSLFNVHQGRISGVQSGGIFNMHDGDLDGVQSAGIFNLTDGQVRGVQAAGVFSMTGYGVSGVQVAGVFNAAPRIRGLQASLIATAEEVDGAQVGLLNVAGDVRGVQLGLFNFAEDVDGVTLGLLNIVRFGVLDFSIVFDDRSTTWFSLQHGTEWLYTIYQIGVAEGNDEAEEPIVGSAIGFGTRVWNGPIFLDLDLSARVQSRDGSDAESDEGFDYGWLRPFPSLRVSGGLRLGPRIALVGGVAFDARLDMLNQESFPTHSGISFKAFGEGMTVFPHVFAGVTL